MTVVSTLVPRHRAGVLVHECHMRGVTADFVEADEASVTYDLTSPSDYRTLATALRVPGVEFLVAVDSVEHGERVRVYPNRQTEDEMTAVRKDGKKKK